jgi:hypothetical protein
MNRILKTTVASLFAASMLAGGAYAQSDNANSSGANDRSTIDQPKGNMESGDGSTQLDTDTTGSVTPNYMTQDDVGGWTSGNVTVVQVSTLNDEDPNRTFLQDRMNANPAEVAALQSSIESNAALKAQLESQNVQLKNIVAAEKAADGSVTFYVQ